MQKPSFLVAADKQFLLARCLNAWLGWIASQFYGLFLLYTFIHIKDLYSGTE